MIYQAWVFARRTPFGVGVFFVRVRPHHKLAFRIDNGPKCRSRRIDGEELSCFGKRYTIVALWLGRHIRSEFFPL